MYNIKYSYLEKGNTFFFLFLIKMYRRVEEEGVEEAELHAQEPRYESSGNLFFLSSAVGLKSSYISFWTTM